MPDNLTAAQAACFSTCSERIRALGLTRAVEDAARRLLEGAPRRASFAPTTTTEAYSTSLLQGSE